MDNKLKNIARIVILFWLVGWYIKLGFYGPYLLDTARQFPVRHPMFPAFFQDPAVANTFYFLPLIIVPMLFLRRSRQIYLRISAFLMVLCPLVLNLHIDTCNDATFVTSFWAGLWLLWFVFHQKNLSHAKTLAVGVVSIIFWGGFVGKLTPEYWNGQVMTQILQDSGDKQLLGQILFPVTPETRETFMLWFSRFSIVTEAVLACSFLWPVRLAFILLCGSLVGFCLFSSWKILSVLSCLVGLMLAAWLLERYRLQINKENHHEKL